MSGPIRSARRIQGFQFVAVVKRFSGHLVDTNNSHEINSARAYRDEMSMKHMKVLGVFAVAALPLLFCGSAFAGVATVAPELDPGTASGGIALAAVAAILLIERYRSRAN